jgi:glycosyltransferase involved in cell wall biosynthesis
MLALARGLLERGARVELVLSKAEGPFLSEVPPQLRVVDLGARRVRFGFVRLVSYLRETRPSALLVGLNHANVMAVVARAISRTPTRIVLTVHNHLSTAIDRAGTWRARVAAPWMMQIAYPRADSIVAVSEGVASDLANVIRIPEGKLRFIYNPIVTRDLFLRAEEDPGHRWFDAGEPPVILGVGSFSSSGQKDFPTLIRAFAELRAERDARLIILGDGEQRPALERLIEQLGLGDYADLPGFVANPFAYMRRAAVFALSSRWEGLPTVLVEAMACGTPSVATDCPSGPREILDHGRWGTLVPVGDASALARGLDAALGCRRPPDVARRAADFSIDRAVDQYLKELFPGETAFQPAP